MKNGSVYNLIFKNGDDLRTDQLIMQMIFLMDTLMKKLAIDLRLTVYQILAYGSNDGIMECVDNATTVQDALKKSDDKLYNYLLELTKQQINKENPSIVSPPINDVGFSNDPDKELKEAICKIDQGIMNNYLESLAGYCVITYLLGIGDRHLENLMLDNKGKLFHIDFGYAMGEDPKPFAPPFKLDFKMILALGGKDCDYYKEFEKKCVTYFLYLRGKSKLILNLMHLMIDSNLIVNPKKNLPMAKEAIDKMAQKFILNETEKKAEAYFLKLIKESVEAIMTVWYDKIHILMGNLRG